MSTKWKLIGAAVIVALGVGGGVAIAQGGDSPATEETSHDDDAAHVGDSNRDVGGHDDDSSADGADNDSSAATP